MSQIEIRLPKMGESVTEATITNWLKNVGDTVEMDEPLVEVATDKVDNELPSEAEGTLVKILFEENDVAQVGDVIAIISTDGSAPTDAPAKAETPVAVIEEQVTVAVDAVSDNSSASLGKDSPSGKFYSPLVRSIAEKEGISMAELESVSGSGQGGRVTKKDILGYIDGGRANNNSTSTTVAPVAKKQATAAANTGGGFLANIKEPIVIAGPVV